MIMILSTLITTTAVHGAKDRAASARGSPVPQPGLYVRTILGLYVLLAGCAGCSDDLLGTRIEHVGHPGASDPFHSLQCSLFRVSPKQQLGFTIRLYFVSIDAMQMLQSMHVDPALNTEWFYFSINVTDTDPDVEHMREIATIVAYTPSSNTTTSVVGHQPLNKRVDDLFIAARRSVSLGRSDGFEVPFYHSVRRIGNTDGGVGDRRANDHSTDQRLIEDWTWDLGLLQDGSDLRSEVVRIVGTIQLDSDATLEAPRQ